MLNRRKVTVSHGHGGAGHALSHRDEVRRIGVVDQSLGDLGSRDACRGSVAHRLRQRLNEFLLRGEQM